MDVFQAIKTRRAIHNYIPNKKIPKEDFEKLIDTVRYTPSWYNAQPWKFLIFQKKESLEKIKEIAFNQEHVTDCSAMIVVIWDTNMCRNSDRILEDWVKYWYCTKDKVPAYKNAFCKNRSREKLEKMTIRNVSLACMNLMITANAMWLATCPMLWFNQPMLSEFLELEEDFIPVMLTAIWYEDKWKEKEKLPLKELDEVLEFRG